MDEARTGDFHFPECECERCLKDKIEFLEMKNAALEETCKRLYVLLKEKDDGRKGNIGKWSEVQEYAEKYAKSIREGKSD